MGEGNIFTFSSLFVIFFEAVTSLRDVKLLVQPETVIRGQTAALICSRDMQGAPLYSVKWYRGNHEFFRYTPMEKPDIRVFGLPGIYVDMNRSNGTQVLLRRLDLGLAGNFSCEVTAESPHFTTQIATQFIDVIALPDMDPVLQADKDRYQPNEILKANCSAAPARPPANLTIYVNDEPIRSSETSLHSSGNGLFTTRVIIELMVTPGLFPGGRLRLECAASIYKVYASTAKLDFFTPDTDPRPERITLNGGASACFCNFFLFIFLLLVALFADQDNCEILSICENTFQYYDDKNYYNAYPSLNGVIDKTCILKPDTGPCRGDIAMYYFKPDTFKCERFSWGGCQGNGNRFDTKKECMESCLSQPSQPRIRPRWCSLAFDYGYCFGGVKRWYYDAQWKVCKKTLYSGCGGNKNNFYSMEECDSICRFNKGPIKVKPDVFGNSKKVLIVNPIETTTPGGRSQSKRVK